MTGPAADGASTPLSSSHYFDGDPTVASTPRDVRWSVAGLPVLSRSDSGVFSGTRLDAGTAVLLERGPVPTGEVFLDLGCGWGPITVSIGLRVPAATVWAVDVNARARSLTRANADSSGIGGGVRVAAPDDVPADVVFDEIWSNPPVRIGKPALHALLQRWLPRIRPGGRAVLVVSRNLGADSLAVWLSTGGHRVERVAGARGYRVLSVHPGAASGPRLAPTSARATTAAQPPPRRPRPRRTGTDTGAEATRRTDDPTTRRP